MKQSLKLNSYSIFLIIKCSKWLV